MNELWRAPGYMLWFEEIRVFNRYEGCRKRNFDSGRILAYAAEKAIGLRRLVNPIGGNLHLK